MTVQEQSGRVVFWAKSFRPEALLSKYISWFFNKSRFGTGAAPDFLPDFHECTLMYSNVSVDDFHRP